MSTLKELAAIHQDGYENELTGIGAGRDKTKAATFVVNPISNIEAELRWRGSDLGRRIVEVLPDEMLREGFDIHIQPDEDDEERVDAAAPVIAPAPPKVPKPIPEMSDEGPEQAEQLHRALEQLRFPQALALALKYERAYGGAALLVGADDGEQLDQPLREDAIKSIRHITPVMGGLDGELGAYDYYVDPRLPRWGEPSVYQLRSLGTSSAPQTQQPGRSMEPAPATLYVHESRLIVFDGQPVSRRAQRESKGWGESVFTRVEEVLSQYKQTWGAVANLMQDFAQGVLKVKGLAEMFAANDPSTDGALVKRAVQIDMARSIARVMLLDAEEEFAREVTPLTGIADILREFSLRLAAASDMPVSLLMGQVQGGLGDAAAGDLRFFYDRIKARQRDRLLPQVQRMVRLLMLAKDGPTKGAEPARWSIVFRPLWQPTEEEQADVRLKQSQVDKAYIDAGVLSPEEVAASRFGGSKYSTDTVLDLDGRVAMAAEAQAAEEVARKAAAAAPAPPEPKP